MKSPALCSALLLTVAAGCGSKGPPTGTVDGKITYGSEAVEEGNVVFENREKGWFRAAPLGTDGKYQLKDIDVGEYVVSVRPPDPDVPDETTVHDGPIRIRRSMLPNPKNIPQRFRTTEGSPLTASVTQGNNRYDFDLSDGESNR